MSIWILADSYSPGTIRRVANVLSCIFKTAGRWNLIENNPCRYAQKPKKKQEQEGLRYFTPGQSLMFLKSLDLVYPLAGGGTYAVPLQYRIFYTLSIFCGFRKGETLALRWDDIDFGKKEISISKSIGRTEKGFDCKELKNAFSVRRIPLPDKLSGMLAEYREVYHLQAHSLGSKWQGDGSLFIRRDGRRMGHTTTYQHFVRHLERYNQWVQDHPVEARAAGLEELPHIPLHGLRHSCATLLNYLEVNIVDISKYLGHASCSTTMNIYAHSFEEQKRAASDKLNQFMEKNIQLI